MVSRLYLVEGFGGVRTAAVVVLADRRCPQRTFSPFSPEAHKLNVLMKRTTAHTGKWCIAALPQGGYQAEKVSIRYTNCMLL